MSGGGIGNFGALAPKPSGEPSAMHMTLRDYFAAEAMNGMLANGVTLDTEKGVLGLTRAQVAYSIADAMLTARDA